MPSAADEVPAEFGSNDEREQTLNQLLSDMDGFEPGSGHCDHGGHQSSPRSWTRHYYVLVASTGRWRFPLPNQKRRLAILAIHGQGKHFGPDVDLDAVSRATPGFSGADLANLDNEAAINAVRAHRHIVTAADFDTARDRLLIGLRDSSNVLLPEEKHSVRGARGRPCARRRTLRAR